MRLSIVVLLLVALTICGPRLAAESELMNAIPESVSIESFVWLAGHWIGAGFGGTCEEVWGAPSAGTMVGTFKMYDAEGVKFYEIMTIAPDSAGRFILKVKHFNADLTGWEEKDKSAEFELMALKETAAQFGDLKYERLAEDSLRITVTISHKDGTTSEEVINCKKQ